MRNGGKEDGNLLTNKGGYKGYNYEYKEKSLPIMGEKFAHRLEMVRGENLKSDGNYSYEYKLSGPSMNKTVVTQTKIISSGNSQGKFNDNIMSKGSITSKGNTIGESLNLTTFKSFGDDGNQTSFKSISNKSENEQKNKYDKNVKSLASQTNNIITNMNMNMSNNMNMGAIRTIKGEYIKKVIY